MRITSTGDLNGRGGLTDSELAVASEQRMPERKVPQARVTLEDGCDAHEEHGGEQGLALEGDRERGDVREHVQLEDGDEEGAKVVKDLDEEVPPEADRRRQVGDRQAGEGNSEIGSVSAEGG